MAPIVLAVLLLAYPLSIGPVVRFHFLVHPLSTGTSAIDSFYFPINWLSDHFQWVSHIVTLYVQWWFQDVL